MDMPVENRLNGHSERVDASKQPSLLLKIYSSLLHKLPLYSGVTALSFNKFVNKLCAQCDGPVRATYRDGTPIEVSLRDHDGRVLYLFGTNDPKVSHVTCALLNPGDVFLDIGANYSSIGLAVAKRADAGQVHLFEPQNTLCERIDQALRHGDFENVTLHRIGLLDEDGSFTLVAPEHHSGKASFANCEDRSSWKSHEECEVRDIAKYVAPLIEGSSFGSKLDIEGAENKVMPWLLAQPNLRFLVFENSHNRKELYNLVQESGLSLYGLKRHPLRLQIERIDSYDDVNSFHDLVAIRVGKDLDLPKRINPYTLASRLRANP